MGHKFDVAKRRKLDSEERRRILPPKETLLKVGLQEGDTMADIGCGIGYFMKICPNIHRLKLRPIQLRLQPQKVMEQVWDFPFATVLRISITQR